MNKKDIKTLTKFAIAFVAYMFYAILYDTHIVTFKFLPRESDYKSVGGEMVIIIGLIYLLISLMWWIVETIKTAITKGEKK